MDLKDIKIKPFMLLPILPIVAIVFFCLRYSQNIFDYYLPNSQWNDEVIYYKTIEGIMEYGIPQGYFGYNESHAQIGTFGAWSPVIYIIDALWGGIFGWNLYSPIVARIVFAVASMVIYALICKPDIKETITLFLFVVGFTLYSRYLVSQMADCYIVSLLIIFAGLYERSILGKKYGLTMALIVMLTLMRPYYVLLWLLIYEFKSEKRYHITEIALASVSMFGYFAISKLFTAAYFSSLIDFDWLNMIFTSPVAGIKNLFYILVDAVLLINSNILMAFFTGSAVGSQYLLFYLLTLIFIILCFLDKEKSKWARLLVVNILFWLAIVLLYDVGVGSRHLMPFIMLEGFIVINGNTKNYIFDVVLIIATCYLCLVKLTDSYLMTYPSHNQGLEKQIDEINQEISEVVSIDKSNKWDNTVLWVLSDVDGGYPWQMLYGLPAGMGINICTYDYVVENFDNLNAKYIACTANGEVSSHCKANGWTEIFIQEDSNVCFYQKN
mgnify:CR=1 FL=1